MRKNKHNLNLQFLTIIEFFNTNSFLNFKLSLNSISY